MRTHIIFWGILLISLGLALVLNNFDLLEFDFSFVFKLWPIILIIWGLTFLKIHDVFKKILAGFSAILITLLFVALIKHDWWTAFKNLGTKHFD